jgi:hypothetical protein
MRMMMGVVMAMFIRLFSIFVSMFQIFQVTVGVRQAQVVVVLMVRNWGAVQVRYGFGHLAVFGRLHIIVRM